MENAEQEKRAFNEQELEKVNQYKNKINQIDETIKAKEEARNLMTTIKKSTTPPTNEKGYSITEEIRALKTDQELEIGTRELRDMTNAFSTEAIGSGNSSSRNIAKTTFADYILDKLAYVSPLYGAVRHERFGNSKHQIPVQANKLGEFVPMKELAEYSKQVADFAPIKFALPIRYRSTATWVLSDQTAKALTDMKFTDGTPVLVNSYNGSPVGMQTTILGRPVIINEHIANLDGAGTAIYFGDLKRTLIVGERKVLSLQKSTEYGFINDEIAI